MNTIFRPLTNPLIYVAYTVIFYANASCAEVILDNTLDRTSTKLVGTIGNIEIPAEVGQIKNTNLFHSFKAFSIAEGESVTFTGPNTVLNVISRVTGPDKSFINGNLISTLSNADFWFINPMGVVFGPQSTLSVNGSFHVSTAHELRLGDGGVFSAVTPRESNLTISAPEGFGFLSGHAIAPIKFEGAGSASEESFGFGVGEGKTFSVVGGDLQIVGNDEINSSLKFGGQFNLISVASPGEVRFVGNRLDSGFFPRFGSITIRDSQLGIGDFSGPGVLVRGASLSIENSSLEARTFDADGAGIEIDITGNISLINNTISTTTGGLGSAGSILITANHFESIATGIRLDSQGSGAGGNITINANTISLTANSRTPSSIVAHSRDQGRSGEISLNALSTLSMEKGSQVSTLSTGSGAANDIRISTKLFTMNSGALVTSETGGSGQGGNIHILDTGNNGVISITNSTITSRSAGSSHAGKIDIQTNNILLSADSVISSESSDQGDGGDIKLFGSDIALEKRSKVSASTSGSGSGGEITISNLNSLRIADESRVTAESKGSGDANSIVITGGRFTISSGGKVLTETTNRGKGGDITILSDNISLTGISEISSASLGEGESGKAGNITITAADLSLTDESSLKSSTRGSGSGGNITVNVPTGPFSLDKAVVTSETSGSGRAGNIVAEAKSLQMKSGATITARTNTSTSGEAGVITIEADNVQMDNNSLVSAETLGAGSANTITIRGQNNGVADVSLANGSEIKTSSAGGGDAKSITIDASRLAMSSESKLTSDTNGLGTGGKISVHALTGQITLDNSHITSDTRGEKPAGDIEVHAADTTLDNQSSISASTLGVGHAGAIKLSGDSALRILNGSEVSAKTTGAGVANSINVSAGHFSLENGSKLTTETSGTGNGGDIFVSAREAASISRNSAISSSSLAKGKSGRAGDIEIDTPNLTLSGGSRIASKTNGTGAGGTIALTSARGQNMGGFNPSEKIRSVELTAVNGSEISLDESSISSETSGAGKAGKIDAVTAALNLDHGSEISARTTTDGTGNAGEITVTADRLQLDNGSTLSAASEGAGQAGAIAIRGRNDGGSDVSLSRGAQISTRADGTGDAAAIDIQAGQLTLDDHSKLTSATAGSGTGGNITVDASGDIALGTSSTISSDTQGDRNAGNIKISGSTTRLDRQSSITAITTGAGQAGRIDIKGPNDGRTNLRLTGDSTISTATSDAGNANEIVVRANNFALQGGSKVTSETTGSGTGGEINIDARNVQMAGDAHLSSKTSGSGNAGNIKLKATELTLDNATIEAQSGDKASGDAGRINVTAAGSITLDHGALISAESKGTGRSKNMNITAGDDLRLTDGSTISVGTRTVAAGDIKLTVGNELRLSSGSRINTSAAGGKGKGGNIDIDPVLTIVEGGSLIKANAEGGNAGNITITSDFLFASPSSTIEAKSRLGIDGNVQTTAPDSRILRSVIALPATFIDPATLLSRACSERLGSEVSTLVIKKYELLPESPYALGVDLPRSLQFEMEDTGEAEISSTDRRLWPAGGCGAANPV